MYQHSITLESFGVLWWVGVTEADHSWLLSGLFIYSDTLYEIKSFGLMNLMFVQMFVQFDLFQAFVLKSVNTGLNQPLKFSQLPNKI